MSNPPQVVRWVGQDAQTGLPRKRRHAIRACQECKVSKKRCIHNPLPTDPDSSPPFVVPPVASIGPARRRPRPSTSISKIPYLPPEESETSTLLDLVATDAASQLLLIREQTQTNAAAPPAAAPQPQAQALPQVHVTNQRDSPDKATPFIGELNPEGIFVEATLASHASIISPDKEVITSPGIWIDGSSKPASPEELRLRNRGGTGTGNAGPSSKDTEQNVGTELVVTDDLDSFYAQSQQYIVAERGALVRATDETWSAMKRIYLNKISPILPIFDESILDSPGTGSLLRRLIEASVCLAAASDPASEAHLIIHRKQPKSAAGVESPRRPTLVSYQEYSQAVVDFIQIGVVELRTSEPQEHVLDCVSVMAITSFFWQPGPHARFSPMDSFAMLASMVHTYGIHLMGAADARAPFRNNDSKRPNRLFRCIYAIDRLIGAFYARPLQFHNYDVVISLKPHDGDTPSFKLFMALITHLDEVIELYRPRPTINQADIDFPVFERLIMESEAQNEPDHILGTLEVLYHAISILSVRMPRSKFCKAPEDDELRGCVSFAHLPPNRANARRSLSADRIAETIRTYELSPMPFVPYALALTLSVQYRKWRFSRTPMFRARAKAAFEKILPILHGLGKVWTSARVTSSLGEEVVKKLSKIALLNQRAIRPANQEMDVDDPSVIADKTHGAGKSMTGQGAVQNPAISPPTHDPTDLPTPAMSNTTLPSLLGAATDSRRPTLIADLLQPDDPASTRTTQVSQEFDQNYQSEDLTLALDAISEEDLAGFDWTLANTLDPSYYASSYYWYPFQGGAGDPSSMGFPSPDSEQETPQHGAGEGVASGSAGMRIQDLT